MLSKSSKDKPSNLPGRGFSSSFIKASAKLPTAVFDGGIEECPPFDLPIISRVKLPFSATLIIAISLLSPGIMSSSKKEPSSKDHSSVICSSIKNSAIFAAPLLPPISSSKPNAKKAVLSGSKFLVNK